MHAALVIVAVVATGLAGLVLAFALILFAEVRASRRRASPATGPRPAAVVVVPAHDEAENIARTLTAIGAQRAPTDAVVVVADNCSDDTAGIARAHGAIVVERTDAVRRGKGYALDAGIRHALATLDFACLVIMDADCVPDTGCLDALVRATMQGGRPAQATYLMGVEGGFGQSFSMREFAWMLKNHVRPLGLTNLGFGCNLTGSGMAFPRAVIAGVEVAGAALAEDLKLGLDCALAGHPPRLHPDAVVWSQFAPSAAGQVDQKSRWIWGQIAILRAYGPRALAHALAGRGAVPLAMLLDLCVPPLSLVVLAAGLSGVLALAALAVSPAPLVLTVIALTLLAGAARGSLRAARVLGMQAASGTDLVGQGAGQVGLIGRALGKRSLVWKRAER